MTCRALTRIVSINTLTRTARLDQGQRRTGNFRTVGDHRRPISVRRSRTKQEERTTGYVISLQVIGSISSSSASDFDFQHGFQQTQGPIRRSENESKYSYQYRTTTFGGMDGILIPFL